MLKKTVHFENSLLLEDVPHPMDLIGSNLIRELDIPPNDQVAPSNHFTLRSRVHSFAFNHRLLSRVDHAFGWIELDDLAIQANDLPNLSPSVLLKSVHEVDLLIKDQLATVQPRKPLMMDLLDHKDHGLEDTGSTFVTGIGEDDPRSGLPSRLNVDLDFLDLGLSGKQAGGDPIGVGSSFEQLLQRQGQRVDPFCRNRPFS